MHDVEAAAHDPWAIAAKAGMTYFAIVFAAGFLLGTLRVLFIIPRLGETVAVALELPIILALSWVACRWVTARLDVPGTWIVRIMMGSFAFAVLMLAELGVSTLAFGRSIPEHLEQYRELPALLGLGAQIAFAIIPLAQIGSRR